MHGYCSVASMLISCFLIYSLSVHHAYSSKGSFHSFSQMMSLLFSKLQCLLTSLSVLKSQSHSNPYLVTLWSFSLPRLAPYPFCSNWLATCYFLPHDKLFPASGVLWNLFFRKTFTPFRPQFTCLCLDSTQFIFHIILLACSMAFTAIAHSVLWLMWCVRPPLEYKPHDGKDHVCSCSIFYP